jgi:transposase
MVRRSRPMSSRILTPTLKRGNIVFMDNVSVHKAVGIREAIEKRGAILIYHSAYSPDFNLIEQVFAKLKVVLRKIAAYTHRKATYSIRSLCNIIASCLDEISRAECVTYFAH